MAVSAVLILGHNAFDGVRAATLGAWAPLWNVLHQQGVFVVGGVPVVTAYPLMPWVGVMAAGFCFGPVLMMEPAARRRVMIQAGLVADRRLRRPCGPSTSTANRRTGRRRLNWAMSVVSFFRATKYPPSLMFLLMTMGPALLVLAWIDRRGWARQHPLVVIGRVPLFYYVVHFWLIHVVASVLAFVSYGSASLAWLFMPLPSMGGPAQLFPPGFGYPLWVAYAGVDRRRADDVSAVPLVCRREGAPHRLVAGISLVGGLDSVSARTSKRSQRGVERPRECLTRSSMREQREHGFESPKGVEYFYEVVAQARRAA